MDPTNKDISSEDISRLCNRFRVLIIGRRNAGKTTILEKMTGSEVGAKPEIRDKEGRLVVRTSLIYLTLIVKLMAIG
jgi:GTPase SAR1 family protein